MTGKNVEVGVQILYIHRHVRNGLGTVYKYGNALPVGIAYHFPDRIHRTQHIGDMGHADNLCTFGKQLLVFILQKLPLVIHRNDLNGDAFFSSQQLPGNDIAVMLHDGKNHLIPLLHKFIAETGYKQVDTFRRTAGKDYFIRAAGIDKLPHRLTRCLVQLRSLLRKKMHTAMHIGIDRIVLVRNGIYHLTGFLCGRTVIKVNQRLTIYFTRKYREISSYLLKVHIF